MSVSFRERMDTLSTGARVALIAAVAAVLVGVVLASWWALRPAPGVLFANLQPRDAAVMTAELDRLKVPYQLSGDGSTILVAQSEVHRTRLKLLSKELPLNGVVGFEVFNASDFGMTEFAQKVNYQRALQGEITRTIMAIDAVQNARVHLALPEQGLFKRQAAKPKASVTLTVKPGHALDASQINGIQRLVAASVPEITPADVTVLDQRGVALSRAEISDESLLAAGSQLEMKRSVEDHLTRKLSQVLDKALGPGQALASIDATLNLDQNRVTTEEVLPAKVNGNQDGIPTGVLVRERQNSREPADASSAKTVGAMSNTENEYQVGRRIEQTTVAPGSIRRLSVAIVVRQNLDAADMERINTIAAAALGLNKQRGDVITVQALSASSAPATSIETAAPAGVPGAMPNAVVQASATLSQPMMLAVLGGLAVLLVALMFALSRRSPTPSTAVHALDAKRREQLLLNLNQWLTEPGAGSPKRDA